MWIDPEDIRDSFDVKTLDDWVTKDFLDLDPAQMIFVLAHISTAVVHASCDEDKQAVLLFSKIWRDRLNFLEDDGG